MKTTIVTICSTLLLTGVGVATGCDVPNEPEDRSELLQDDELLLELLESDDPESVAFALEAVSELPDEGEAEPDASPNASFDPAMDSRVSPPMQSATCEDIDVVYENYRVYVGGSWPQYRCFYAATGVGSGCEAACSDWAAALGFPGAENYGVYDDGTSYCWWATYC